MSYGTTPEYGLNEEGEFVISSYNSAKPFSSFFPGVAGLDGIPMWVFYVNRGQGICSMGIQDKNSAIMEFMPANRAYQLASTQGFRTFIKLTCEGPLAFYEPFQNHYRDSLVDRTQRMIIAPAKLTLEEVNRTLGLTFIVEYFNVVQDEYAGLVRTLSIRNDNAKAFSLEGLDGMPLVVPYGVDNAALKFTRRLVEAFVEVVNLENDAPLFRGKVEPVDRPEVVRIKKGNFYLGFDGAGDRVAPIVDPAKIFGNQSDYSYPERFLSVSHDKLRQGQVLENRYPCAMGHFTVSIPAGETYTYTSIMGHVESVEEINGLAPRICRTDYVDAKERENRELIDELTQPSFICSSEPALNQYVRMNYLDNGLRGGFPITLKGGEGTALHLYSRKHGDLERDYNDYRLSPTKYSQGNGHYRDVNQNRRSDLLFNPDIGSDNVEHFYNLIQLDGFNPQVIKEMLFQVRDGGALRAILTTHLGNEVDAVKSFLGEPFTPGLLMRFLKDSQITLQADSEQFIGELVSICEKVPVSEFGEGFWTDHWTYNLDLLENYLCVYPENLRELLFEKKTFTFYDSAHRVLPRDDKYVLWNGKPMQLGSVYFDEEKAAELEARETSPKLVRTGYGAGEIFKTNLLTKMLSLIVNKMASLDPKGVGIEMEADKPNWYDAINGLPGVLGSSLNETLETKRSAAFLLNALESEAEAGSQWPIYEELAEFMIELAELLGAELSSFDYWDNAATAKELYREKTIRGICGKEAPVPTDQLKSFLSACIAKLDAGIGKAWYEKAGIIPTYFMHEVLEYEEIRSKEGEPKLNPKGMPCYRAKKFKQLALPAFLEGPVHYLRTKPGFEKARELAGAIRKSDLYDRKLKMYKVNAPLGDQPMEIGRNRVFSPGWFENESIWLHMEYKFMLEFLRNGLYEEFYRDFKDVFVPFFDPAVYGRSTLENSSFIVSEANPDPSIHGNGFVARLSGATAEFIEILQLMAVGPKPFSTNDKGELTLSLSPALPSWLFTKEAKKTRLQIGGLSQELQLPANTFSFLFLGNTLVTYHNPNMLDTYGPACVSPDIAVIETYSGNKHETKANNLTGIFAETIRARKVKALTIYLN